jgi:hypothetical protein
VAQAAEVEAAVAVALAAVEIRAVPAAAAAKAAALVAVALAAVPVPAVAAVVVAPAEAVAAAVVLAAPAAIRKIPPNPQVATSSTFRSIFIFPVFLVLILGTIFFFPAFNYHLPYFSAYLSTLCVSALDFFSFSSFSTLNYQLTFSSSLQEPL